MIIKKIFNNNAVVAKDSANREVVAMGCGIAFKMSVGEILDQSKVEKTFILKEKEASERFKLLLEDVEPDVVSLCYDIIEYAKNILNGSLNDYIYVTLTDHIYNVLKLQKEGFNRPNVIIWEIKKFYPKEYAVGQKALEFIKDELEVELPEDEAGNIALHLINAQVNKNSDKVQDVAKQAKMVQDILNIVRYTYNISLDEKSLSYERFVTHLRFFFQRLNRKDKIEPKNDDFLLKQVKMKYEDAYNCMLKIEKYLNVELDDEEKLYLTLHVQRITSK
ncbi:MULTISPECIES: BglG family transcription antiterminator LicT [Clostridium]|uniref:Transcription antiterminator LicT n=1 Tax=Clostridium disporicum TaxID=84024 RepID=A0A174AKE4_9CLOT|nr:MULTISPECIES: PRD domain-containing protein [Clostridium]MCD2501162.1 PRD domain-containing protein [Clostridium sp. NSJ-145]MDU6340917.1 PRD domain-containing protein [Clostridium sp.]CUN88359.1 transcription antiterminator LicT [Clostridium disporicum]